MAKELPYFKFEPAEYLTKDISFCSLSAQGLFTNICCYYWQRKCKLTKSQLLKRLNHETELNELIQEGVIDLKNEDIVIKFLDLQLLDVEKTSKKNSINGAKGGRNKLNTELTALDGKVIPRNVNKDDHFLYLFKRKSTGTYKVGETQDLFKRRSTIKIPSSDLSIIHFVMIDRSINLKIESDFKSNFESNHINGDWFDFESSEIANVVSFMEAKKAKKKPLNSETKGIREDKIREEEIKEDEIKNDIIGSDSFFDVGLLKQEYSNNEQIIKAVINNNKLKVKNKEDLLNKLDMFCSDLKSQGKMSEKWSEFTRYFNNCLSCGKYTSTKPNNKTNGIVF